MKMNRSSPLNLPLKDVSISVIFVKDLASVFRRRIELRQVGVKRSGG